MNAYLRALDAERLKLRGTLAAWTCVIAPATVVLLYVLQLGLRSLPKGALSGTVRQVAKIQSGLVSEKAKEISKAIKDSKLKVQAHIQGEQVRVLSKSKDDLQSAIAFLRGKDFGIDLQFANYR